MKDYLEIKERGWFIFRDESTGAIIRWDRENQHLRAYIPKLVFKNFSPYLDEEGISFLRVVRLIQCGNL